MQIPAELRPEERDGSAPAAAAGQEQPIASPPLNPAPIRPTPQVQPATPKRPGPPPPAATSSSDVSEATLARREPSPEVLAIREKFDAVTNEVRKIYVGQDELVLGALVALFSGGHVLIESVPGLGKTLFVRVLGQVLGCRFGRIQFTADLMPSDITGAPIFDMKNQEFRFRPGPVFTQLLLADEINRSPAKTHAALLEIMQEYRVTVDGTSHVIERPFLVLATQNPIESEGTYNLPEAQLDRFMFKIVANYPAEAEEANILRMHGKQIDLTRRLEEELNTVSTPEEIVEITRRCNDIFVDERLIEYINKIVRLTREWPQFHMGASPRAGIALMQGARTLAAFRGRDYAVPDDVIEIALQALRHRVSLTAEAEVEGHQVDTLLNDLIRSVEVPRL
ncbi:MAG: AAA family ATPase [Pirellulales bacterium]